MTTIGTATLQVIPSLLGVSEAIEKQIDGKVIGVAVEPKVDQRAAEQVGKQTRETVEKQTTQVKVEPKVDTRAAEQAGKKTGEAVTKGANDAVRKGDIGKTVSDEVTKTVEKSSPGKEIAKVIVDGIADGVKDELRGGPLVDVFVDGLADGVKQGIDDASIGTTIIDTIRDGIKSGNIAGSIKDAVLPGITQIGSDLRSGAADWASGIGEALRGGDIQGATDDLGNTVRTTTDIIANIGSTFGLQLDGVREFGDGSATTLSTVGGNVQDILDTATSLHTTFTDTGNLLGTVLPGRAGSGAKSIINSLGTIVPIAAGVYEALNKITQDWHAGQQERFWSRWEADNRAREAGIKPPQPGVGDFGGPPAVGQGNAPAAPAKPMPGEELRSQIAAGQIPGFSIGPNGQILDKDGKPVNLPGFNPGGYTGNFPIDQIAGVVHGGEFVIRKSATDRIQAAAPGLLDTLNGYAGGGLVAGTAELRKIIGERFGISDIGGYRPADKYGEHSTGRALDVMVGNNKAKGDAVKDFVLANADAVDLKWVIWRQHLSYPGGGGYDMPDRGNPTQNHMDHVHIFSGTGIANGLRGALKGGGKAAATVAPTLTGPDPTGISAPDQTPATDASLVSSTSGGGVSIPSSISGLSTFGLDQLGSGVGKTSSGSDLSLFADAASSAVSGQVSSALGVLGVPDSPGWLKGISTLASSISIGGGSSSGDGYGGAAPVSASAMGAPALPAGDVHGSQAGRQPGPAGPTYNIRTATVEDAFLAAQRRENVRLASMVDRY